MKPKTLGILAVVLVAIVGIVVLTEYLGNAKPSSESGEFFPGLSKDELATVRIGDSKNTVEIRKENGRWVVAPDASASTGSNEANPIAESSGKTSGGSSMVYPADSASVQSLVDKLVNMKRDELISQNPENRGLFEVDTAKGIRVTVWKTGDNKLGTFYIGKSGPDWSSNYVRMEGSDKVYTARGSIRQAFFTDDNRWRDKSIIAFDPEKAEAVTLAKKNALPIRIEKRSDTAGVAQWYITSPENAKADNEEVKKLVTNLSKLKAGGWEEDLSLADSTMGFNSPELTATITMENGETKTVTVANEKSAESKFWVRAPDKPGTFLVTSHTINNLDKNLEELTAKEAEELTADVD